MCFNFTRSCKEQTVFLSEDFNSEEFLYTLKKAHNICYGKKGNYWWTPPPYCWEALNHNQYCSLLVDEIWVFCIYMDPFQAPTPHTQKNILAFCKIFSQRHRTCFNEMEVIAVTSAFLVLQVQPNVFGAKFDFWVGSPKAWISCSPCRAQKMRNCTKSSDKIINLK